MKKKIVSIILTAVMTASLAGCGSTQTAGSSAAESAVDYGVLMMGVLFCSVPTMVIFFFLQKSFTEGITGAVK